jgi:hypothetical protein
LVKCDNETVIRVVTSSFFYIDNTQEGYETFVTTATLLTEKANIFQIKMKNVTQLSKLQIRTLNIQSSLITI